MGQDQERRDAETPSSITNPDKSIAMPFIKSHVPEIIFFFGVASVSMVAGFGFTLALTKKKDPRMFMKGLGTHPSENGVGLALRALGVATGAATAGVATICLAFYALSGASNMQEFRTKVQSIFPAIPKKAAQGRNDFESVGDLVDYIVNSKNS